MTLSKREINLCEIIGVLYQQLDGTKVPFSNKEVLRMINDEYPTTMEYVWEETI